MAYTNIDDPSAHFQTATWSGNASTQSITNDGNSDLKPDWAWTKDRGIGYGHKLMDSSRGIGSSGKFLITNSTAAESSIDDYIMTFNTDGFSVGAGDAGFNASNDTYVTWQWKANGGTTATNNDGSLTSTVQANTDAGFSIVTYAGASSTNTIGHGLGVAPKLMIVRARNKGVPTSWVVFHKDGSTSDDDYYILQSTAAKGTQAGLWNNQYPSSTVFGVANDFWVSQSGVDYIAYCFAEKQGYSKFGKYVGNGSSNGTFVYTGFAPAFVMLKDTSQATNWEMFDVKRNPFNVRNLKLGANLAVAENGSDLGNTNQNNIDILSNGFKMRTGNTDTNVSGDTYIYMAFAENPFVTSTGIPAVAR